MCDLSLRRRQRYRSPIEEEAPSSPLSHRPTCRESPREARIENWTVFYRSGVKSSEIPGARWNSTLSRRLRLEFLHEAGQLFAPKVVRVEASRNGMLPLHPYHVAHILTRAFVLRSEQRGAYSRLSYGSGKRAELSSEPAD